MALSRAQKKYQAIERARRRLDHRLSDIDWELDVLAPETAEIGKAENRDNVNVELEPGDAESEDYL